MSVDETVYDPTSNGDGQAGMVHSSKGSLTPDPSTFLEQGVNSPFQANPVPEYNPRLYPKTTALQQYENMKRNDAQVRSMLRILKIQIMGGDWYVEPADTGDDQTDKDVAEFVQYNFFDNMSITWNDVLAHALTELDYGSAVLEYVYEIRSWRPARKNSNSKNYVMIRKLAPRPAYTIIRYRYDDSGGPRGVDHQIVNPDPENPFDAAAKQDVVFIPIDQLLVFTYDQEGGNKEGLSILRTAYQHWFYKTNLYKIDAIQKERHGIGVPEIELPPGYDKNDLKFAANLGRNLRTNERAFILKPAGWVVGFAKVEGQLTNALASAEHHDMMIARNVLAQFVNSTGVSSGAGAQGGRSNGAIALDLLLKSLRQLANQVCDVFNLYCIPKLVDYNFDVIRYPKLRVRGIGEARDLQMIAAGLRNLVSENIISVDDDTERYVRRIFDLPVRWDKKSARVNEQLLKPFTDPSGVPVPTARSGQPGGGKPVPPASNGKPAAGTPGTSGGSGRGPAGGNQPKATTEG